MNLFGGGGAYFALFSEIGILLLTTTLLGVGGGVWLDGQLGTKPVFIVVGFLLGAATGAVGIFRLLARFLARLDAADRERREKEAGDPDRQG